MESVRRASLVWLSLCLLSVTGCATSMRNSSLDKETPRRQTLVQSVSDPIESTILERIPDMHSGKQGMAHAVSFTVLRSYMAASGRQCKSIRITTANSLSSGRERVACEGTENWFFSKDLFLTDADID